MEAHLNASLAADAWFQYLAAFDGGELQPMCCRPLSEEEKRATGVRLGRSCAPCRGRHRHMFESDGADERGAVAILAADAARRARFVRGAVADVTRECESAHTQRIT